MRVLLFSLAAVLAGCVVEAPAPVAERPVVYPPPVEYEKKPPGEH
jgi:hypothetical protein